MFVVDKILVVDAGNTSIKYTLFQESKVIWQYRDEEALKIFHSMPQPDAMYVASVRSESATSDIVNTLQACFPTTALQVLHSQAQACGVKNAYDEPARLGVDRWLTVIAAHHHIGGNLVIVDAGTAIKVDVVNTVGEHLGGYITPGLALMEQSLLTQTAKVRYVAEEVVSGNGLPNSTARAVAEGCHEMVLGFLDRIHSDYADYQWVVTGGDGEVLMEKLGISVIKQPYLVALGAKLVGDEQVRGQK